jgi:hypothetical protein
MQRGNRILHKLLFGKRFPVEEGQESPVAFSTGVLKAFCRRT